MNAANEPAQGRSVKGARILVVEDDGMISSLVEEMLLDLGCDAVWCAEGTRQAAAILRAERPDAVLLDVNLPGEPGYALADTLVAAQIPFVFVTGYGQRGVPEPWADRPVIQKPFKLAALAAVLERVMSPR